METNNKVPITLKPWNSGKKSIIHFAKRNFIFVLFVFIFIVY